MDDRFTHHDVPSTSPAPPSFALATIRNFRHPEPAPPDAFATAPTGRPPRRVVAGYELLEEIGSGGMGVVYRARQVHLDRVVALKMIRSSSASRDELVRFRTEAEAIARLAHPNIVTVYEVGEHDDQPFLSLEYCAGGSLDRCLDGQPLPPQAAARLIEALARAAHFAHERGIVHRDLKPANILLGASGVQSAACSMRNAKAETEEPDAAPSTLHSALFTLHSTTPKIADFGLAKRLGPGTTAAGQTLAGEVIGTPSYMAPEQAEGRNEAVGPATDVYALGAILYECLTGRPPFVGDSMALLLEQVRNSDPVAPGRLAPAVPRDLDVICLKCLHKSAERRYASAWHLAEDLRRWRQGEPIHARPAGPAERALKWARRRPTAAALVAVSALLVGVVTAAVPLHIARLRARVEEASAAALAAHERQRQSELVAECARHLADGRAALGRGTHTDVQEAVVAFATVAQRIADEGDSADAALAGLAGQARALRREAEASLARLGGEAQARQQLRAFLAQRDEAYFHLHLDLLAAVGGDSPRAADAAARKALKSLPDLALLSPDEQAKLRLARQEVYFLLAEATVRGGGDRGSPLRWREGLAWLDRAGDLHSAHRRQAAYLEQMGDRAGAQSARARADATPPAGALDWFLLGQERLRAGAAGEALAHLTRALELQPDLFWAELLCGVAHTHQRDYHAARAAFTVCLRARPTFAWLYALRGHASGCLGLADAAEADFARAESQRPEAAVRFYVRLSRGTLAHRRGQHALALRHLEEAAALCPDSYHAHAGLSLAHAATNNLRGAVAAIEKAIDLAPRQPELYRARSLLRARRNDLPGALADVNATLRLQHALTGRYHGVDLRERARLLYLSGRYGPAMTDCEQALRLRPGDPAVQRLRAELLLELGRHRAALQAFNRYLARNKPDAEIYRRRAQARAGTGDLAGVIGDWTAALELRRDAPLLASRGWAYLVNGAPLPALRDFEAALALAPDHEEARLGRASARLARGDARGALADVDAVLLRRPKASRLLYLAASVQAQASAKVPGREGPALRQQALANLREAVLALPEARRAGLWREQVKKDPSFRPLSGQPAFARLEQQFARP